MRTRLLSCISVVASVAALSLPVSAQDLPEFETGLKPYGAYHGGDIDSVSLTNGNLTVHIPLFSYPQRGGKLTHDLMVIYNNKGWRLRSHCNKYGACSGYWTWQGTGVSIRDPQSVGGASYTTCTYYPGGYSVFIKATGTGDGATHALGKKSDGFYESLDTSGIRYDATADVYTDRSGIRYPGSLSTAPAREDTNGNKMTTDTNSVLTDTLARQFAPATSTDTTGCPAGQRTVTGANLMSLPGPPSTNGATLIKTCNVTVPLQTNFLYALPDGSLATEYSGSKSMIQSIVLCNSSPCTGGPTWTFEYDSRDTGDPSSVNYGDLTKISFPFGGSLSYTWTDVGGDLQSSRAVLTRTLDAVDGTGPHTWAYTPVVGPANGTNVVTDPLENETVHTITHVGSGQSGYITQTKYYQGSRTSGTLLKTVTTDYTYSAVPGVSCGDYGAVYGVAPIRVTTTWPGGKTSKVEKDYDSGFSFTFGIYGSGTARYGNVVAQREYDYGSGTPGALTRQTINSYLALTNNNYKTNNLLDLLSSVTVKDGVGNQKALTSYGYDAATPDYSGISIQHDSNPPAGTYRGNQTSISRWLNTSGNLTTNNAVYDTGMVHTSTDPGPHTTTYAYSANFAGAYVTSVTDPMSHVTGYDYDFNTGLRTSVTDANSQSTTYTYDYLWRTSLVTYPTGGGAATYAYNDSIPATVSFTRTIDTNTTYEGGATVDGVGRVSQTRVTSDPDSTNDNTDFVDTTYDTVGRKHTVSNPYRTTSDVTYGITTFSYDALNRVTQVASPYGGSVTTSYAGNCTTVTDQQGKIRKSCTDGLARLTQVFEPDTSNNLVNETDYQYDTLDNLTRVDQKGNDSNSAHWRTRTFVYDSLSRLTSAANPESGTTTYTYNYGNDKLLSSKQDARGITTTYASYDADHRLLSKTYSDSSPAVSYSFDQSACLGQDCHNVHRRTAMTDGAGSEGWAYDAMGRVLADQRTTNSIAKTFTFAYNFSGSVDSVTYPSGRRIDYGYSAAARVVSAQDITNGVNYALSGHYAAHGGLSSVLNGQLGGFAGYTATYTYNKRLQPWAIQIFRPGGVLMNSAYNFGDANGYNNGNVMSITNYQDTNRSQFFTYDQLNRIATAYTQGDSPNPNCWGLSYGYDIWANLTTATVTKCTATSLGISVGANNRISTSGYAYDAAGNLTSDPLYSYVYDAENRQTSAAGVTYTYDGDGQRVKKSNGKLYWYGVGGEVLTETDLSGNNPTEYVFFGGRRIARRDPSGTVYYYFGDHLGTSRVIVQAGQTAACYEADFYPFGGERTITNTCPQNYKFTGKERDTETGNDYFGARYYASNLGRFTSPDPRVISRKRTFDPQQWNMYVYTRNNPLAYVDPDGRELKPADIQLASALTQQLKSEKVRVALAPYMGKDHDLTIQRGKLGNDPMEPDRKELGKTEAERSGGIKTCSPVCGEPSPITLKIATITIDDSVKAGKGKEELQGVLGHEISHAGDAARDPAGSQKEEEDNATKKHDDRPQEQRADKFSQDAEQEVKQYEKQEKKQKEDEEP